MTSPEFRAAIHHAVQNPTYILNGTFRSALEYLIQAPERHTKPVLADMAIMKGFVCFRTSTQDETWYPLADPLDHDYTLGKFNSDILEFCHKQNLDPKARSLLLQLVEALVLNV